MPRFESPMSGASPYYVVLRTSVSGSTVTASLYWRRSSARAGSFNSSAPWRMTIDGASVGSGTINFQAPGTGAIGETLIATRSRNVGSTASARCVGVFEPGTIEVGTGTVAGNQTVSRVPGAPGRPTATNIVETAATIAWTAAAANGSPILNYGVQVASNTSFTDIYFTASDLTTRSVRATGLRPAGQFYARVRARNAVGPGPWSALGSFTTQPVTPPNFQAGTVTATSIPLTWERGANGSQLSGYRIDMDTDPSFSNPITRTVGIVTSRTLTGRTPDTTYYIRIRAYTSSKQSDWSATLTVRTSAVGAPTITVVPSPFGSEATLTLTPSDGAGNPTFYRVEYRRLGDTTVTTFDAPTSPHTVEGLIPGATYEWRASAFYGSYQSPWTDWVQATQPNPKIGTGDYFDGDTPDRTGIEFVWDGTDGLSTSRAVAPEVIGWMSFDNGAILSGGTGVVTRMGTGYDQDNAALVTFHTTPDTDGFEFGQQQAAPGWSDTPEAGTFFGSIFVRLEASQNLAPVMTFFDNLGNPTDTIVGAERVVPGQVWTRVTMSAIAPPSTVHGTITLRDIAGEGWREWLPGEQILADAAMITIGQLFPYFNGETPSTPDWDYEWLGDANASPSRRLARDRTAEDPLADPDCPPPPLPPAPPEIVDDCLEPPGTWRRLWLIIPADEVRVWLDAVPTIIITTAETAARQVRIRFFANPENLPPEEFDNGTWEAEQIISYIPANTTLTVDGVSQRVWAEVDGGERIAADRILYGTGGRPATWPTLSCGYAWLIAVDVPLEAAVGSITLSVGLTSRSM